MAPRADSRRAVEIPAGVATLGAERGAMPFGWDNEFDEQRVHVDAFDIDVHSVTNAEFLEFVDAGGYRHARAVVGRRLAAGAAGARSRIRRSGTREGDSWFWRGDVRDVPLPPAWPVYVSHDEAAAFARWRGRRLPTEAEFHRAAFGTPAGDERAFPWGDATPGRTRRGNFDFQSWDPVPAGARPRARARGAFTISSATAGNGRRRSSRRSPDSRR